MEPCLPLELQHDILKLAIPPFSYRMLSSRRETCRRFALVHRTWTPIAQAELQRCFPIRGSVYHAGRQAEKALVARALEEEWPVEDLVIEDDGVPVGGGRTTALPHPLLKKVKRAVVGTVFSVAALRSSSMPSELLFPFASFFLDADPVFLADLRKLTIVRLAVENKRWWPDDSIPPALFYPSLTRLHLVKVTLHSLPPLPHLDTLLFTHVTLAHGISYGDSQSVPLLRSLGCKARAASHFLDQVGFLSATLSSLQNVFLSIPSYASVEAVDPDLDYALHFLPSSISLTLRTAAVTGGRSLPQLDGVEEMRITLTQQTYTGEVDDMDLEDWRPE